MMSRVSKFAYRAPMVVLMALLMCGCASATDRSQRASADWSRGLRVGSASLNTRVGLVTDRTGDSTTLVWIAHQADGNVLRFARLDNAGRVVAEGPLAIDVGIPSQVELTLDAQGVAHVAYTARVDHVYQLWYASFDAQGGLLSQPVLLSLPDVRVVGFAMCTAATGESDLMWVSEAEQGGVLYQVRVDAAGGVLDANVPLRNDVTEANARCDRNGGLHVAWMEEPADGELGVYYATLDRHTRELVQPNRVVSLPGVTGLVRRGPEIGLGGDYVYLIWSLERRGGGLTQSSAETYYVAFPLGHPELAGGPQQVLIPTDNRPDVAPQNVLGQTRLLAPANARRLGGRTIYMPATPQAHLDALVGSLAVNLVGRTRDTVQIVTLFWDQGTLQGYQIAGKTTSSSLRSSVAVDDAHNVHLAWVDTAGFGNYDVYYASTAPAVRAELDRVRATDVMAAVASMVWALAGSLALFPVAFMWFTIPLAIVSVYLVISAEGDMERRGSRIMMGVSVLVYVLLKYATESSWLTLLQLPGMPAWLANLLVATAPFLVASLAVVLTWWSLRRRDYRTLFRTFVVFVAWDALITLLLYVPILLIE